MSTAAVMEIVSRLGALDPDALALDADQARAALADVATGQAWFAAWHPRLARHLDSLAQTTPSLRPDAATAVASKMSIRSADQSLRRAATLGQAPSLEQALSRGEVSAEHADALTRAVHRAPEGQRQQLLDDHERLTAIAASTTPEQFAKALTRELRRIDPIDGADRLQRMKGDVRLRWWTDKNSGMWKLFGQFDPESGMMLQRRLELAREALFHSRTPQGCPDGDEKNAFLNAHALMALLRTRSEPSAAASEDSPSDDDPLGPPDGMMRVGDHAEITMIIDAETYQFGAHDHSVLRNEVGADLPVETYRRWSCVANLIGLLLDGRGRPLNHGRSRRLASRQQRRALFAMYETCAIDRCAVDVRHCHPHHVQWWEHGGPTDVGVLIPACSIHHHKFHEGGWRLAIDRTTRDLTVTYPDGTTEVHPYRPPGRPPPD